MSSSYYANPLIFLIDTLFSLYILAFMLRFLFQWLEAEFYNPVSQFIVRITHPLVGPARRILPPLGRIDTASVVLMIALQALASFTVLTLKGRSIGFAPLLVWSCTELVSLGLNIFIFAIIARAILSWITPGVYNPVVSVLFSLTEPMLRLGRSIIPPISGIDLSPLVVLVALQLIKMMVIPPLQQVAAMLS